MNGAFDLTVNTAGITSFGGVVGGTTPLSSLTTDSVGSTSLAAAITTTNAQTYNDPVTITASIDALSATDSSTGDITFNNTLNGAFDLRIAANHNLTFNDVVGGVTPLGNFIPGGATANLYIAKNISAAVINTNAAITLIGTGDKTFTASTGPLGLNTVDGAYNLILDNPGTTFLGNVGSITPLISLTTDAGGKTNIDATVTTTGAQTYNDAVNFSVVGSTRTLTSTGSGDITFNSTINGGHDLIVNTAGATKFNGIVGGTTPVTSITTDAAGTTQIGASITTSGAQTFNDAVTLTGASTLTSNGSGNIDFVSTLNGGFALNVNTAGITIFGAVVGGSTPLTSVATDAVGSTQIDANVTTTSTQSYGDAVSLGTDITLTGAGITLSGVTGNTHQLTLTDSGTSNLNGAISGVSNLQTAAVSFGNGSVTTSGTQSYGAASLGADTTLTSSGNNNITFNSTINGAHALAVNTTGVTTFSGIIGGSTPLSSLTTNAGGSTRIGASITTDGAQTFNDAVTLTGASTLTSNSSGNIDFASTLDGGFALNVNTAGITIFGAAVGGSTPLTSVSTDSEGSTQIYANLSTTSTQSYGDAVSLGTDITLTGAGITLSGVTGNTHQLTLTDSGTSNLNGAIAGVSNFTNCCSDFW